MSAPATDHAPPIGFLSAGAYIPQTFITAAEIAERSGVPEDVIVDKMGIVRKPVTGPGDHTNAVGLWAADELVAFCGGKMARFKIPKSVVFAEELPKTAAGKVDKKRLVGYAVDRVGDDLASIESWVNEVSPNPRPGRFNILTSMSSFSNSRTRIAKT